jgi:hypothetical protein
MNKPLLPFDSRFPPRLTMEEYVAFIEESLKYVDPKQVARQKAIEKRIDKPFRLVDEEEKENPAGI